MTASELLAYIFGDEPHPLGPRLEAWMAASPRFRAFVATYRDKIRKKIRGARDAEALKDLLLELETAALLLGERRFEVAYEKYGLGKARGPDFVVTFKSGLMFNLEVTRLRAGEPAAERDTPDRQYEVAKLSDVVCGKLGQMLPGMVNLLIVYPDDARLDQGVVMLAMARLKERAERRDADFLLRRGFASTQEFFKHYQRLSGILVRSPESNGATAPPVLWSNPQARQPLPASVGALLRK